MHPSTIVFADVETTGLSDQDRVVSIGLIRVEAESVRLGALAIESMHLIFDPGRSSHPRAEQVHGYSDWVLRHQDPFRDHAGRIRNFLHDAPIVAGHNVGFDAKFIDRELSASGHSRIERPLFCTMDAYRRRGLSRSASLDTACAQMGRSRLGERHGALEDAWLAMAVYFWLQDVPFGFEMPEAFRQPPENQRAVPPRPRGAPSRRTDHM